MPAIQSTPSGILDMLIEEELITTEGAQGIQKKVREAWIPIGELLWQQGHLTRTDLLELVQKQACEPHLRLGEIAVREGFCTQRDILKAVQRQRESNPHPLDILLADDQCDAKRLNKVLVRYIRQLEARNADLPS